MSNSSDDEDLDCDRKIYVREPVWNNPILSSSSSEADVEPIPDESDGEFTTPKSSSSSKADVKPMSDVSDDEFTTPKEGTSTPSTPGPGLLTAAREELAALEASQAAINESSDSVAAGRAQKRTRDQAADPDLAAARDSASPSPRRNPPRGSSRIPHPILRGRYIRPRRYRRAVRRRLTFAPDVAGSGSTSQGDTPAPTSSTAAPLVSTLRADMQNMPNRFGTRGKDPKP